MQENLSDTLEKIQQAALEEFSEKGFQGASLRQIVKYAGVTTGAFYGYFSSKAALFASIVEPHAAALMGKFMEAQTSFAQLPEEEQPEHMGVESGSCVQWMVNYICQHREPVKLLLCRAEKWNPLCNTWKYSGTWDTRSRSWTGLYAILLPAVCLTAFSRS